MFDIHFPTAGTEPERSRAATCPAEARASARRIALLRSGHRHGTITRLITPWDIAELTAPFLFLGYYEFAPGSEPLLAIHPQHGVGSLTLVLSGTLAYRDDAGNKRTVTAGGFKWTTAGRGVRHDGGHADGEPLRAFQLWIGLPPSPQGTPAESEYVAPREVPQEGPVRVLTGQYDRARGVLAHAPPDINCFHVRLRDGQRWRYTAPDGHRITWLAVDRGGVWLQDGERVLWEQIALFGDSPGVIEMQAEGETSLVLGSARRISHSLVQQAY